MKQYFTHYPPAYFKGRIFWAKRFSPDQPTHEGELDCIEDQIRVDIEHLKHPKAKDEYGDDEYTTRLGC